MAKKELTITATNEQISDLKNSLKLGTPITLALQYARIPQSKYLYWVAIYSVALTCKEQQELEELESIAKTGISIQEIKEMSAATTAHNHKSGIGTFIEPTQEAILRYKNSKKFRDFADQCYKLIDECNQIRSQVVMTHLSVIQKSTDSKNRIKASGSMWFLERTASDFFGRAADKAIEQETTPSAIPAIRVEYIDPGKTSDLDRLHEIEEKVLNEMKGSGDA